MAAPTQASRKSSSTERLATLAKAQGLSIAQLALAYVLSTPGHVFAVLGCRDRAELLGSVAALGVALAAAELCDLNAIV